MDGTAAPDGAAAPDSPAPADGPAVTGNSAGWLHAGTVGRPHGLDGSFYVIDPSPELLTPGEPIRVDDRELLVTRRAGTARRPILHLEGCEDRDRARALGGQQLLVTRDRAPELGPDEWWAEDLEGCEVRGAGRSVGVVKRLLALPSCEVLEVSRTDLAGADERERLLLVPLVKDAVRRIDLDRREIEIDLRFLGEE
jgi:16S rRNA processing protein RimM